MVVLKMRRPTSSTSSLAVRFVRLVSSIRLGILLHRVRTRLAFYRILHRSIRRAVLDWKVVATDQRQSCRRRTNRSALRIDIDLMGPYGTGWSGRKISVMPSPLELVQVRDVAMRKQVCVSLRLVISTHSPFLLHLHCRNRAHAKLA
jgi:hypothetical protein